MHDGAAHSDGGRAESQAQRRKLDTIASSTKMILGWERGLPDVLLSAILSFLDFTDLCAACGVCRAFRRVGGRDDMWTMHCLRLWPSWGLKLVWPIDCDGGGGSRTGGAVDATAAAGGGCDDGADDSNRRRSSIEERKSLLERFDGPARTLFARRMMDNASTTPPLSDTRISDFTSTNVVLHIEIREERCWSSPSLYSAIVPLSHTLSLEGLLYHPTLYRPHTLPHNIIVPGALAMLVADNIDDGEFTLVLDVAAVHVTSGRVARLYKSQQLRFVQSWQAGDEEDVAMGAVVGEEEPTSTCRMVMDDGEMGPESVSAGLTCGRHRMEVSFMPAIEMDVQPRLISAPLEVRFFNLQTKHYRDEAESCRAETRWVDCSLPNFFLEFLANLRWSAVSDAAVDELE